MEDKRHRKETEDVVLEDESTATDDLELEDLEAAAGDKLKALREKLKSCEKEKMGHFEALQRTKADFLNSKKRLEEQLQRDRERITVRHIETLLPLADSFDLAMNDPAWKTCDVKWRKGIEGIRAQLTALLKSYGVSEVSETGVPFDPRQHEAVSHEGDGDTVVRVLQKGYLMGETVIRPARVSVGITK